MTVADYLVAYLRAAGVKYFFGFPGTPLLPFLEAIRKQNEVKWVLMRHENAAALAAAAHAKLTGELSVCVSTSGPGVLQTVCGVMDAHLDKVPLLALTGMVPTAQQGHWEFQDINQTSLYNTLLPFSASCINPFQMPALLRNAIGYAIKHQCATHLSLSQDVLSTEIDANNPYFSIDSKRIPVPVRLLSPPAEALNIAAGQIDSYQQVVIVIGNRAKDCGEAIELLAKKINAPIITTLDAKGVVDESSDNCLGVLGIFGFPAVETTKKMLNDADLVLAFGVDTLKPFLTNEHDIQVRDLIECEPDFASLSQHYHRRGTLIGNLSAIANGLAERLQHKMDRGVIDHFVEERNATKQQLLQSLVSQKDDGYVHPITFFTALNKYQNKNQIFAVDTGGHTVWLGQYLSINHRQPLLVSARLGTMGFCLPALIAARLQQPDASQVIGVCGDGGFAMTCAELATAVQYNLSFVLIVFTNGVLQNVMAQQAEPFGTTFHNPDIVALAKAYGCDAALISTDSEIEPVLEEAFKPRKVPFIISLKTNPNMGVPISKWQITPGF
jgi:thiamine pyrophosphate-dependent acetolactate synthase large subunit-like protein